MVTARSPVSRETLRLAQEAKTQAEQWPVGSAMRRAWLDIALEAYGMGRGKGR